MLGTRIGAVISVAALGPRRYRLRRRRRRQLVRRRRRRNSSRKPTQSARSQRQDQKRCLRPPEDTTTGMPRSSPWTRPYRSSATRSTSCATLIRPPPTPTSSNRCGTTSTPAPIELEQQLKDDPEAAFSEDFDPVRRREQDRERLRAPRSAAADAGCRSTSAKIERVTLPPMTTRQLLIGGEWVDGADGAYDVVNPATEEVVDQAPGGVGRAGARRRPRRAATRSTAWSRTTPEVPRRAAARRPPRRSRRASRICCRS